MVQQDNWKKQIESLMEKNLKLDKDGLLPESDSEDEDYIPAEDKKKDKSKDQC